jgi:tetratricopeptide (TPR) repeat protein
MKKFNTKLFLYLIGATVLLGAGLFVVHYFQSGRIANAMLWQARRAEEKGDLSQTARYLRRYLEFQPNDMDERANLGRILADPKMAKTYRARENALFVLDQVVSRDPDRNDLRRPLVRVATELGQYDLARQHLDVLESAFPRDGEVQFLRGQWYEAQAKYARAEGCYRKATEWAPKKTEYLVRLATLLHQKRNRPHQAQEVLGRAEELARDDASVLLLAADLAQSQGDLKKAKGYLTRGSKKYPHDPSFYQALARLEVRKDRRDEAVKSLRKGLKTLPNPVHPNLHWTIANLLLDDNKLKEAEKEIAQLRQTNISLAAVDYLQARLCVCRQQWPRAARLMERVRPKLGASPELITQIDLYRGECYEHMEEPVRRLEAFKSAADRDPKSATAWMGQGAAELAVGHTDNALQCYKRATQLEEAPLGAWSEYARLLINRNRQREKPDLPEDDKATAWAEVDQVLAKAKEAYPKAIEIPLLQADALAARDKFNAAEQTLLQGRKDNPREVKISLALVALAENQGDTDKAHRLLKEADKEFGDTVELRLAWARHLVQSRGQEAVKALPRWAEKREQFKPQEQSDLLRGLAEVYYSLGKVKEAARLMNQAADLPVNQNDLRIRLRVFDLYLQAEDDAGLQKVLAQMRRLEGEQGIWWRYGRASRLLWQARKDKAHREQDLDEAGKLLDAVAVQRPAWPAVPLAKAEIADLRGNPKEVRNCYESARNLGEKDQRLIRQMVQLGQEWAAKGQRSAEAEQNLRLAIQVAPTAPEAWVSLVQYLAATGQLKEARAAIDQLKNSFRGKREDLLLVLGHCFEIVGQKDEARKRYQLARDDYPNDVGVLRAVIGFHLRQGNAGLAQTYLEEITERKNPGLKVGEGDMSWAKRSLAFLLANGGDYPGFLRALELLGMKLGDDGKVVIEGKKLLPQERDEVQRTRARVLATRGTRAMREKAIALLEEMRQRRQLLADDEFLLAQLLEANGNWDEAEKRLCHMASGQGHNPLFVAYLAQKLLERGQLPKAQESIAKAQKYIDKVVQLEIARRVPEGTFGSIELRARALEIKGEYQKARDLLRAYATAEPANAEKILAFAGFLARRNRLPEALDQCERAWKIGPPEGVGGATVALLRTVQPRVTDCNRVEKWLQEALVKNPESLLLKIQLADLHDLKGQYREAERLYREVLDPEKKNNNPMALNNLAWLLALRKKEGEEAKRFIDRAIQLLGPRAELLDTRAMVYLALGESRKAAADLEQAIAEKPTAARYFHLARALHMARKKAAAKKKFKRAKEAGLEAKGLHPLERGAYHQIAKELDSR